MDVEGELRARILRQELVPGTQLREEKLASELGVTRNAVRTALLTLAAKSLVERIPNVGAVVARPDPNRLLEIYDVLELLEGLAARLAAQNSISDDWAELVELFHAPALEDAVERGDFEVYLEAVERYRSTAIKLANHSFLSEILSDIHDQVHTISKRILMTPGRAAESLAQYRSLIQALSRGDAEGAEQLKRQNMQTGRSRLLRYGEFLY